MSSLGKGTLLTETEVSKLLGGVRIATLRRWRWAGKGPVFRKIGACVRYQLEDVEAYIHAARRTSTSDRGAAMS